MTNLSLRRKACVVLVLLAITAIVSPAQTFTQWFQFDYADGGFPQPTSLVQGTDGSFYGVTYAGGVQHLGVVFKISSPGTSTTLFGFQGPNNAHSTAGLIQATDGNFYGTTSGFGFLTPHQRVLFSAGTIFKITGDGTLTTLYTFCNHTSCIDGSEPHAALVQAKNGIFYGTTTYGGAHNVGTVFQMTADGTLTTLYSFCAQAGCADGAHPFAGLIQATDGNFYGATYQGGANNSGTIFEITAAGTLTTLYSFCAQAGCADGSQPYGRLVQATDENFYGTTYGGGAHKVGTVFKITSGGALTTLHSFSGVDGANPYAGLVQATDGNFYGTTQNGGANKGGTVFEITPAGALTPLYDFCSQTNCADGAYPRGGLIQGTDGNFYGTTEKGGMMVKCSLCGTQGEGTIFSLSVGLAPFVDPALNSEHFETIKDRK
ncbi:MAG: choice-of-anchor tandem repeat GloVer-containing protein [Terriglobales bacterium]